MLTFHCLFVINLLGDILKMKQYFPRYLDNILEEMLNTVGAVLVVGPKWVGKTTTAERHAKSVLKMQDPDMIQSYLATIDIKPSILLQGPTPRLIDEWQVAPVIWDAIRAKVDELDRPGLYILTGSTSVDRNKIMHSGTGRIARLVMYPMSLFESNDSNGKISLKALFDDKNIDIDGIKSNLSIEDLIMVACRGGWPSTLNKDKKSSLLTAKIYLDNICEEEYSTVDGIRRDSRRMRTILRSYARNISTLASDKTLLTDISANDISVDARTLKSYLLALEKLYVIEEVPAWCPNVRSATSIRSSNKREFVDPSIAIAALNLSPELLLHDLNTFGFIFETLCIRDLKVYSAALGGTTSYYHDKYGLEADCVLHLDDGRYALIEFKLGNKQIEEGAKHLLKLKELISNAKNENKNIKEPDLLMIITGGEIAYTREDGIKVVPIGCLKA